MSEKSKLKVFECCILTPPDFNGKRRPEVCGEDESPWHQYVAETRSKARYLALLDAKDGGYEISFADIDVRRVKSDWHPGPELFARLELANKIISVIARYGRRFLSENSDKPRPVEDPFVAHFVFDAGELWYIDRARSRVLVRHDDWHGFSEGGTLRNVVEHLRDHILEETEIRMRYFSKYSYWGYGEDMVKVEAEVRELIGAWA